MRTGLKILHCSKGSPIHPLFQDKGIKHCYWDGKSDDVVRDWKGYDYIFLKVRDYSKVDNVLSLCTQLLARLPEAKCPEIIAVGDSFKKSDIASLSEKGVFDYFDLSPASSLEERLNFLLHKCTRSMRREKEYRRVLTQTNSLKSDNKDLKRLTLMDDLTGLHNTRFMKEIFGELFNFVHRYERPLSVFMLDLDHFKDVNDSNDHLVGSTVLKEIGRILKEHTRKSDIQIRYGGDEFVVLMPETPVDSALRVAERVRKTISELTMTVSEKYVVKVTAILGFATFDKTRHSEYWELLERLIWPCILLKNGTK
ncbi:MAG: diguanylate cyclase [Bdellovibrionota bacterium]